MPTLVSTVISRTIKGFRKNSQPDLLLSGIDAVVGTITYLNLSGGWSKGARIEIDSEMMLVKEADPLGGTASVVRGWLSTTATAHPVNSAIFMSPRIYRSDIIDHFNDCLDDMYGRDLFAVGTQEIVYDPQLIGYGLNANAARIIRVDAESLDTAFLWRPVADFYKMDNAPVANFPTGQAIMMRSALPFGSRFRVVYAKPFGQIAAESNDLESSTIGLKPYMKDLLYYFSMNRIMVDEERHRSQIKAAQSHQRAQDVPPFLAIRTGEWYQARYEDRVATARKRLSDETRRVVLTGYGS